ncbi:hypothetical protein HAX54_041969, partial [Datura stramonium]|nr:hypothetical protein [Datura stramonium]
MGRMRLPSVGLGGISCCISPSLARDWMNDRNEGTLNLQSGLVLVPSRLMGA